VRQVTKSCKGNAKCSGFVAVSHTERAIAVAFRGSQHTNQIVVQAVSILTTPKVSFRAGGGGRVQKYFNDAFLLIWNQLKNDVHQQIRRCVLYKFNTGLNIDVVLRMEILEAPYVTC
jgi:hypothetical protein